MSTLQKILSRAASQPATIVLSEGTDPRIVEAGVRAAKDRIAEIILVGPERTVSELVTQNSGTLSNHLQILDPVTSDVAPELAEALVSTRSHKGMTEEKAESAILDPLVFAAMLVQTGKADGTVGGAINSTADVVRAALQLIGVAPGAKTVSSFFLMEMSEAHHQRQETFAFSDCALVIDPSAEEMAEIAIATADNFVSMVGVEPRVAMLSFSSKGSGRHSEVTKVVNATEIAKSQRSDLLIDGELQFDAAFAPTVGASKAPNSDVAGYANVYIFPNINAGNIGYKIAQRIGGALAIGPILQGLNRPANDLSRGCTADDAYHLIAVTAVQAQ